MQPQDLLPVPAAHAPPPAALPREYLSFRLGQEAYGIDILSVQEIRQYEAPTRMAGAPDFIKGVINLRGVIVPIVDLRLKFGLAEQALTDTTVVVVLNLADRVVGAVVDAVSDVIALTPDQIRPAPALNNSVADTRFITGLGALDERLLILIDIGGLMSSRDMGLFDAAVAQPPQ